MAVSKSLRFQVLRRDGNKCRYCGVVAAEAELTVDHVVPVALGGRDEASNLVTACRPCNSGKSATPPDASLVNDVAEDALRWARALKAAAGEMIADLRTREAHREFFKTVWHGWYWGAAEAKEYAPLPAAWENSIDQIVAAGLPVELLKDCVDTAFAYEKVKRENKFKYACGVAWRKIDKLHEAARTHVGRSPEGGVAAESETSFDRTDLVEDLLNIFADDDFARNEIDADEVRNGELDEDGRDPIVGAVESIYYDWRYEADFLESECSDLLAVLPDSVGEHAMKIVRFQLYDGAQPSVSRGRFTRLVLREAVELYKVREALAFLHGLTEAERGEWIEYARALHRSPSGTPSSQGLSASAVVINAAEVAQIIAAGNYYPVMCRARGNHIQACPSRAQYRAYINEFSCCATEGHTGHEMCEPHLELMVDGEYTRKGMTLTVRDFEELETEELPPPF